ncbi:MULTISPECIES: hypothetical protein [unclassified Rickettsia]
MTRVRWPQRQEAPALLHGSKFIANSTMSFRDLFTESRKIYK